ncbi:MAG: hypothetical protein CMJ59_02015 [Planctomycetaceae bacterium]|nr:hypothetical protein [Planctomycetaceae bacterium]
MTNDHSLRTYDSMLGLLSSEDNPTPLVRLNHVVPHQHTIFLAKLEWYNPFGAIKDRVAANLIDDAQQRNALAPGQQLVEATSGNTGLGLAMIGNARGYPLQTPLSQAIPLEKRTVLRFFGADVVELDDSLCPAPGAPEGAIARARDTAKSNPDFVHLDQYVNEANPGAHYRTTGPEIWKQTGGKVTHLVAGLGTCGTITGTGRFLKERQSDIQVLGVCPEEGHDIPGVRSQRQLQQTQLYRPDAYDAEVEIGNRAAYDLCWRLNREECIIAGPSSGMALAGAIKLVPDEAGLLAVVIFPDNIFKYASSVLRHFPQLVPTSGPGSNQGESSAPSHAETLLAQLMENLKNPYDSVRVKDLNDELSQSPPPLLLDIRSAEMFAELHIPGSLNIPELELSARATELPQDRDAPIVTLCNIGKFSKRASLLLKSQGYRHVRTAKGGLNEWVRKGFAVTSLPTGPPGE